MEQSPSWEANWFSANQGIPHILRNPNIRYRFHKRLQPWVRLLQYMAPIPLSE